jgi:phage terminase large subunit-like protein
MARDCLSTKDAIRQQAEDDLFYFACLVNPMRLYGELHKEVFRWLMREDHPNQLLLLPRAHMKSHCIAVWVAWWITKHPETTVLYISATSELAESQLKAIKDILTSKIYTRYWPNMVHPDEGKRERWSATKIAVDHPKRKTEGVRDATVAAAGLTTTTTGWHADVIVPDDVVVPDNAYTEDGRRKVAAAMSQMASILNTGGITKACGTRYHPADQYDVWLKQKVSLFNEEGEVVDEEPIWEVFERVVEVEGEFVWPRSTRGDGKMFGFDRRELSRISAMYTDRTQFYAQYFNDPNDPESNRLNASRFQYYDRKHIKREDGRWYYKERPLNVYAAIDFAFSLKKTADYTAIVVIGIDGDGNIYILDIDRFKTDKIAVYFEKVKLLHARWMFRKLRAEVSVAQGMICNDLKDSIRKEGMSLSIDEHRPTRNEGNKEERIASVLEPRYENMSIWHFQGGYIPALEEELILARPPHDDIKDTLACAVEIAIPPKRLRERDVQPKLQFSNRFGGVSFGGI